MLQTQTVVRKLLELLKKIMNEKLFLKYFTKLQKTPKR